MAENPDKIASLLKLIATNIVHLRKQLGLTQEELADKASVDRTYIGYLENAKQNVTIGKLVDIATALNVSIEKLFEVNAEAIGIQADIEQLNILFPFVSEYQKLAAKYDINDVFQDNGGKLLQVLLITGLINIKGREGNDAIDETGREYELKSVNSLLTSSFSTHHHLNPTIIKKYRLVDWIFAVYEGIEIKEIYRLTPEQLEPYFKVWETKWNVNAKDINNPKVQLSFVRKNGKLLFKTPDDKQLSQIKLNP
jgi:transcriptional regulator with XRE-family HTH domain